jgi:ATP-binding cassette subfamily B protein
MAGPTGAATSAAAGLPFAGVPEELQARVETIVDREPDHPEPEITFSQAPPDEPPFTLRTFLGPYRGRLTVALVLVVIETLSLQAGPILTQLGIDRGVIPGDFSAVAIAAGLYLATVVLNTGVGAARISFTARLGEQLMKALRIRVFSHLQRLSLSFYTDEKAGVIMTRMTSDIDALAVLFQEGLVSMAVQALTLVTVTIVLFLYSPTLAAITLLVVVPFTTVMTLWFRTASDRAYTNVRDRIAAVLSDLSENLAGIRVITATNRRRHNQINHDNLVGEHFDANAETARIGAIYGPTVEGLGIVAQGILLGVGGSMVLNDTLTLGELVAFILFLNAFFAPIQQLVQLYNQYQQGQAAMAKLRGLLGEVPSVVERADAVALPELRGEIAFEHATFGYDPERPVISDADLRIAPGEVFAFVGPTGAGKSTMAKLVGRFYDPQAGRITVDGYDLRDVTKASLRSQLGIVPQEPFLFAGTIRDNLTFARPEATDGEIAEACELTGLNDLLERLPDGVDSVAHERGASFSAGERQLLALARAFLARPRVLILDEATSNLDLKSETKVERALDVLLEGRTAIVIAHRLATAMRADRIAVIDEGGVAELGTHDELVARGGRYAESFATWTAHAEGHNGNGAGSDPADGETP